MFDSFLKSKQSKYTGVIISIAWLLFLGWHILHMLSGDVFRPLTTIFGSAVVIGITTLILALETFAEKKKKLKEKFKDMTTIIQTFIIVVATIYTLWLGFVAEVLSPMVSGFIIAILVLEWIFVFKEILLDFKGN